VALRNPALARAWRRSGRRSRASPGWRGTPCSSGAGVPEISDEAMERIRSHPWAGQRPRGWRMRLARAAVAECVAGARVAAAHGSAAAGRGATRRPAGRVSSIDHELAYPWRSSRRPLRRGACLQRTDGNKTAAATILGVDRRHACSGCSRATIPTPEPRGRRGSSAAVLPRRSPGNASCSSCARRGRDANS